MILPFKKPELNRPDQTFQDDAFALAKSALGKTCVEIIEPHYSAGLQMQVEACLAQSPQIQSYAVFIDTQNSWVPCGVCSHVLRHILWVRCKSQTDALRAADVVMRDENFRIVLMDLRGVSLPSLKRIPQAQWFRLQRMAQNQGSTLIVAASYPSVASAQLRIEVDAQFGLSSFHHKRSKLWSQVQNTITRQRPSANTIPPWIALKTRKAHAS